MPFAGFEHKVSAVVGRRYPWALPGYTGDRLQQFLCPMAVAVTDAAVNIPVHENYTAQEAKDIATALLKVERAMLLD